MSDTSTGAVERMAQHYDAANECLPDPRENLTSVTLRALVAERDALRAALEYYASDVGNGDVAQAALNVKTPPG